MNEVPNRQKGKIMERNYEEIFQKVLDYEQALHEKNRKRIKIGLKCIWIVPLFFLALLFLTGSNKVIFLILWIVSLFALSIYLIVVEYMDYNLQEKIMELKGGTIDGVNVLEELKALKQQNAQRDADEAVTLALKAGKITPAQKEWARRYALSDPKGFGSFVEKAPQVVPMSEIAGGDNLPLKGDQIDNATMLVCKQLGISAEDVKKYGMKED